MFTLEFEYPAYLPTGRRRLAAVEKSLGAHHVPIDEDVRRELRLLRPLDQGRRDKRYRYRVPPVL